MKKKTTSGPSFDEFQKGATQTAKKMNKASKNPAYQQQQTIGTTFKQSVDLSEIDRQEEEAMAMQAQDQDVPGITYQEDNAKSKGKRQQSNRRQTDVMKQANSN